MSTVKSINLIQNKSYTYKYTQYTHIYYVTQTLIWDALITINQFDSTRKKSFFILDNLLRLFWE